MPFVITESCIQCKYTDCVAVCPMDRFLEGPNFLVIHPDECIDCSMCVPECLVNAIAADHDVPAEQEIFIGVNRRIAEAGCWPRLTRPKPPLPGHEEAARLGSKLHLLREGARGPGRPPRFRHPWPPRTPPPELIGEGTRPAPPARFWQDVN